MTEVATRADSQDEVEKALSEREGTSESVDRVEQDDVDADDIRADVDGEKQPWTLRNSFDFVVSMVTSQLFFCCMVTVILVAWGAPWVGKKGGPLRTEYSVTYGVNGLVFLISGLSLKTRSLIDAFLNMRLNILIQSWVFGFTPGLFYLLYIGLRQSVHIDQEIADGFCLLGCLPMTINMCYVLTSSSNGNDSSALFNATFGNIIGIFLSPLLILGMLSISGAVSYEAVILKLTLQVVCPLVAGQILLNAGPESLRRWLTDKKKYMKLSQEGLLSLVVYASFCNTFASDVDINPVSIVIIALVIGVVQFGLFALAWWFYNIPAFGFGVKDSIAGMFCSVHKTMALGVPVISSMYENSPVGSGVYSIPLLIYHPLLAVSGSILVPIMRRKVAEMEAEEGHGEDVEAGLGVVRATYGVMGATGNVGRHAVASLMQSMRKADNGESLIVFSRYPEAPVEGADGVSVMKGAVDMSDPKSIKAALRKHRVEVLFVAMPQALSSVQMEACGDAIASALRPLGSKSSKTSGSESPTTVVRLSSYQIESTASLPRGQGSLGLAHVASEASLAAVGIPLVSVRPVSFFTNFDKYDLPALVEGMQGSGSPRIASPLGHGATARVNWVSCEDIGAVSAACMISIARGSGPEGMLKRLEKEQVLRVTVTGGEENSLSLREYCQQLGAASAVVAPGGGVSVQCTDLPLPDVDDYADLWKFLRAGGFDVVSSSVKDLTGKDPIPFSKHVEASLRQALSSKGT